jgi:hypothetical protein
MRALTRVLPADGLFVLLAATVTTTGESPRSWPIPRAEAK